MNFLRKIFFLLLLLQMKPGFTGAQNVLTPDDAIAAALKNNFAVSIAKNNTQAASNDHSIGNAGMLPQIDLGAQYNIAGSNTKQDYANGTEVNKNNASSSALNYGASLNWTLFDGLKMFTTYNRLGEAQRVSTLELKLQMEEVISSVIANYYAVVKQGQALEVSQAALKVAEEKKRIAETRFNIGSGSGVDFTQAKVELNNAKADVIQQQNLLSDAKISLNQLLALPADNSFNVTDTIIIAYKPVLDDLKKTVLQQNYSLLFQQGNLNLANYSLRELQEQRSPRINFTSGYNFNKSTSNASFVLLNQNLGWNAGVTASFNLFSGFNLNRQIQNAKISVLNSNLQVQQVQQLVDASLLSSYNKFQSDLQVLTLQEESYTMAKSNLDIALQKYQIGSLSALELAFEQQTFRDAGTLVVTARYNTKLSETNLMKLNGELVK